MKLRKKSTKILVSLRGVQQDDEAIPFFLLNNEIAALHFATLRFARNDVQFNIYETTTNI